MQQRPSQPADPAARAPPGSPAGGALPSVFSDTVLPSRPSCPNTHTCTL